MNFMKLTHYYIIPTFHRIYIYLYIAGTLKLESASSGSNNMSSKTNIEQGLATVESLLRLNILSTVLLHVKQILISPDIPVFS